MAAMSRKQYQGCPEGKIRRRSYTRKNGVRVHSACVPAHARNSTPSCPPSQIPRAAYVRRITSRVQREGYIRKTSTGKTVRVFPKSKKTYVPAGCVKDVSSKNHKVSISQSQSQIGPLRKGELKKHGYSYKLPEDVRRRALQQAIHEFGPLSTYRKLNAVAKLSVSSVPKASSIFSADRNWIRATYGKNGHLSR